MHRNTEAWTHPGQTEQQSLVNESQEISPVQIKDL